MDRDYKRTLTGKSSRGFLEAAFVYLMQARIVTLSPMELFVELEKDIITTQNLLQNLQALKGV